MEIYEIHAQQKLMFGSEIDGVNAEGMFDQEGIQGEMPESIWNDAW